MPRADFFMEHGLFVVRDFLDGTLCARLCRAALAATDVPSTVTRADAAGVVDPDVRRSTQAMVRTPALAAVETRLLALWPRLEQHFRVTLHGCERPQLLVYRPGGMFQPHRDRLAALPPDQAAMAGERQVSVVIFLNSQVEQGGEAAFRGGYLTFYGITEPRNFPLPLIAEPGLLIALRAEVIHAVTPVTEGARCSIVSWFT